MTSQWLLLILEFDPFFQTLYESRLLDHNKAVMMTDECEEAVDPIFTVAEIKKLGNEYKKV